MLFCNTCSRLLDDGADKCPHCGSELRSNTDLLNESHFDVPNEPVDTEAQTAVFAETPAPVYPSAPVVAETPAPVYDAPSMPLAPSVPETPTPISEDAPPIVATPEITAPSYEMPPVISAAPAGSDPLDGELDRLNRMLSAKKNSPVPSTLTMPSGSSSYSTPGTTAAPMPAPLPRSISAPAAAPGAETVPHPMSMPSAAPMPTPRPMPMSSSGSMSAPRPGTDFRAYGTAPSPAAGMTPAPSAMGFPPQYAAAPEDAVGTGTQIGMLLLALLAPLFGLIAGASMRAHSLPARRAFGKTVVITSVIQFFVTGFLWLLIFAFAAMS